MQTRKTLISLAAVAFLLIPQYVLAETRVPTLIPGAQIYDRSDDEFAAAVVVDVATGKRLYAYKPELKWPAASLTKLMSALVVMDSPPSWNRQVSLKSADEVGGGRLRVPVGSIMSTRDLLYSSIVGSANNAAMALARVTGMTPKNFVAKMNKKAVALGMKSSSFADPAGMDVRNTLTAMDAVTLAKNAFSSPLIRSAASTASYQFKVRNTSEIKRIVNTNKLLTQDPDMWVLGGKTGFLYESRNNLIVKMRAYPLSPEKPALYIVVFGSDTKETSFATAKSLANWAYKAYSWRLP